VLTWRLCQNAAPARLIQRFAIAGYDKQFQVAHATDCSLIRNSEIWFLATWRIFMEVSSKYTNCRVVTNFVECNSSTQTFFESHLFYHACCSTVALGVAGSWVTYVTSLNRLQISFCGLPQNLNVLFTNASSIIFFQLCATWTKLLFPCSINISLD